jgi:hypothetical protein
LSELEAERLSRGAVSVSCNNEIKTPPIRLTVDNVIYWSEHYKQLEGVKEGNAIRTKARSFLDHNCIQWDKDNKVFVCLPIKGYNKTTYRMEKLKDGTFNCSCQFYNKVSKDWDQPICSHILALWLYLKLKRWNCE